MSRLDEIKARAEQVHWTSTSVEQAMVRMASSAADVPWLVSEVARLTAERDALAAKVARVEALADAADDTDGEHSHRPYDGVDWDCGQCWVCEVRAALAEPTGQEGDRPHDCRPIYSRSVCGQCGGQEQWCETCSRQMCGCATDGQEADHA